jgi:hypothetical protein
MGDVEITKQQPSFWVRVLTAWTATASLLTAAFVWTFLAQGIERGFQSFYQGPTLIRWFLAIDLAAIFVIAYPVERWIERRGFSTKRAVATYAIVLGALGVILFGYAQVVAPSNQGFSQDFFILVLGLIITGIAVAVACIGRAFYPFMLKHRTLTFTLAITDFIAALLLPV